MKKHIVAKLSSLAVAFALLVGTSVLTTPVTQAASSSATAGAKTPAPYTIVNVGGGTWNYGTENCGFNCKHDWSQYQHQQLTHSATAICGSQWKYSGHVAPGVLANENAYCGWTDSTASYWNTY